MMTGATQLSVVIPVYNEIDNVAPLLQELRATLIGIGCLFEVIFVDDGSTDGTADRLRQMGQAEECLRVVCHRRNYGQSAALLSGIRAARYSVIVTLDGDGQNDPADIRTLLEHWDGPTSVVLGNRRKRDDSILKRGSSWIGNGVRRYWLRDGCRDTGCSLKLGSRAAYMQLPHFNHFHRFLPALFQRAGLRLVNVPVNHRPRRHGVSKYGVMNRLFVGIYDLIGVRWLLSRPCFPEIQDES